jgi:1,4-dihydroxy-2-naphthoyl-CoA synthase
MASPGITLVEKTTAAVLDLANVLYEKKNGIAYVTINRPKALNALNTPTWKDLRTAFADARDDATVRGVILTGAGNKAFIAGADISELAQTTGFDAEQSSRFGQEVLDLIENLGKPVIAAVNGFALGGGCETAKACTVRLAVEPPGSVSPKSRSDSSRVTAERSGCRSWSVRAAHCSSFCRGK